MPVAGCLIGQIPEVPFYSFRRQKSCACWKELSNRYSLVCRGQVGKVPVRLFGTSQAVADQEGLVDQESKIIGLQLHPPARLPVKQCCQLNRSRTPGTQVVH